MWPDDPFAVGLGVPVRPTGEEAERVLEDVRGKSDEFGVEAGIEDRVGVIESIR